MRPVENLSELVMKDSDWLWEKILEFLAFFGAVRFVADPPREQIFNRSLIILDEAKKRGIVVEAIKILGKFKNEYRYKLPNGKWRYFEANPLADERRGLMDHKYKFKKLMFEHGVPVPEGRMFVSQRLASEYARSLGFPVVVKPATGSLGYHSTYLIQNEEGLKKAIRIAQTFRPDFLVEKHIFGEQYRATVIGKKHVFVFSKDLPNVIGNGQSSIEKLIDDKNQDPRRGTYGQKNATLYQIPKTDPMLLEFLQNQGLSLASVPVAGQKIYFYKDLWPGTGIDFINETANTHADNRELFLKAAKLLDTNLVGFDLICADIRRPHQTQAFGVLEANSLPYIDNHQFPSHGPPDDIAKIVWDVVMENLV